MSAAGPRRATASATTLVRSPKIGVRASAVHRWGVFALAELRAGEVLEECPWWRFEIGSEDLGEVRYYWPKDAPWEAYAVVGGLAMVYNHDGVANVTWHTDAHRDVFVFTATHDIAAGDELFISYGEDYDWGDGEAP